MAINYKYQLEKGNKKFLCPNCNKKTFVRFIDTRDKSYLPFEFGVCDREIKCSYNVNPYKTGYAEAQAENYQYKHTFKPKPQQENKPINFDFDTFKKTLKDYDSNTFIQNLISNVDYPFSVSDVTEIIKLYGLGTISKGHYKGAVTFPFIDKNNNVRAIQVKQFDKSNHTTKTNFLHSIIEKHYSKRKISLPTWLKAYTEQDRKVSCLFGEHLLNQYPENPIALVEAPKTAIYGTLYFGFPKDSNSLLWIGIYNKSSFTKDRLKALQGRKIIVFPDLSKNGSTFNEWQTKANEMQKEFSNTKFIFSDLLERLAPENDKQNGNDIADYLIKHDWRDYRQPNNKNIENEHKERNKPTETRLLKEIRNVESRIIAIKTRIREMENTFIEACKRCRIEWYAPKGYYENRKATLSDFKYWNE